MKKYHYCHSFDFPSPIGWIRLLQTGTCLSGIRLIPLQSEPASENEIRQTPFLSGKPQNSFFPLSEFGKGLPSGVPAEKEPQPDSRPRIISESEIPQSPPTELLRQTFYQLQEYFGGKRKTFELPLLLSGTDFERTVWDTLRKIPYGETRSYAQIARSIGREKAFRAVGQANHRNPLPIVVPCHRVIASDGKLGGYACGLEAKRKLLALEKAILS